MIVVCEMYCTKLYIYMQAKVHCNNKKKIIEVVLFPLDIKMSLARGLVKFMMHNSKFTMSEF